MLKTYAPSSGSAACALEIPPRCFFTSERTRASHFSDASEMSMPAAGGVSARGTGNQRESADVKLESECLASSENLIPRLYLAKKLGSVLRVDLFYFADTILSATRI